MRRLTSGRIYKIKTKDAKIAPFVPNPHQLQYYSNKHTLDIIVKARQLWYSTAVDLDYFDDFLFTRNINIWIIADTKEVAKEIFRDKILIARENLPPRLQNYYKLETDSQNELRIANTGSRISVSTSYRWGTLQRLHISEFGKICNKYPEKATEIVTGALETVARWQRIVIESTAKWAEGYFYDFAKAAKFIQDMWRTPNDMEYKLHFSPWRDDENYSYDGNVLIPQDLQEYFSDLSLKGISLTQGQKNRYTLKQSKLRDEMFQEYPSTFDEAFMLSIKWAYYEREILLAVKQKRLCRVMRDPSLEVHTARDIWGAWWWDDTAIWFFQIYGNEVRVIDYREGNGRSLQTIITEAIKSKPYTYGVHFGPHDLKVTEYSTGISRRQTAYDAWVDFYVVPWGPGSLSDGIDAVRNIFSRCYFDEEHTKLGRNHLWLYRRAWDDTNGIFIDRPMKNGAQHAADGFRYLAVGILALLVQSPAEVSGILESDDDMDNLYDAGEWH